MHELLETHFKGEDWTKTHKRLCKEYNKLFDVEKDEIGDLPTECYNKMRSYAYNYREEDGDLEVIATELELEVKMPHNHTMTLKIDMLTVDDLGLWIWEHKNHKQLPNAMDRFMDIQSARYAWAVSRLPQFKQYGPPVGIVWDYIISKPPTKPKLVDKGTRLSKSKINTDLWTFVSAIKEYDLRLRDYRDDILRLKQRNDFFERIRVPVTTQISKILVRDLIYTADEIERGVKPVRNIGRHCSWCDYQKLCVTELYGGDITRLLKAEYEPRQKKGGGSGN